MPAATSLVLVWALGACASPPSAGPPDAWTAPLDGDTHWIRDARQPPFPPVDAWRDDVWPLSAAVRVVIRDATHAPVVDQPVYFHDASGATIDEHTTDADGAATSGHAGIAAITVALTMPTATDGGMTRLLLDSGLYSIWGVRTGDTITFEPPVTLRSTTDLPAGGPAFYVIESAIGSTQTESRVASVWDSAAVPGVFAFAADGSSYALALGGAASDAIRLGPWRTTYDTIPVAITGAPAGTTLTAGAAIGSDVGTLGVSPPASPTTSVTAITLASGVAPGPTTYLTAHAHEDLGGGVGSRDSERFVPYPALATAPVPIDLSAVAPIGELTIDHDTLEVSWGEVRDADVAELTLSFTTATGGAVAWHVYAPGPLDRIRPPTLPGDPIAARPANMPGTVFAQCGLALEQHAAFADYDAFRAHPFGPFDPTGWAGTSSRAWSQLY